ncbi:MAG: hypothetical protein AAF358_03810 [Pseudomonadota bacterium]
MGTLTATADLPRWPAARWGRNPRPLRWFWLALLAHLAALWWLAGLPLPEPNVDEREAIRLELVPDRVEPLPKLAPVPVTEAPSEPQQAVPALPTETSPDSPPAEPAPAATAPTPTIPTVSLPPTEVPNVDEASPAPRAEDILKRMRRYRIEENPRLTPADPKTPPAPLALGLADQTNLLTELDGPLPQLPFEPGEMGLRFYSAGVKGDIARTFDRITPEFGFVTNFGLEVRCKYVLIVVSCGWRER